MKTDYTIGSTAGTEVVNSAEWAGEYSNEESRLVRALMNAPQDPIDVIISNGISDDDLIKGIHACMKAFGRFIKAERQLKPIIGRLLVIAEKRPSVLKTFGADTISDFCKFVAPKMFHVSRTDSWEARQIAVAFPDISAKEYVEVGPSKIKAIGRALDWTPPKEQALKYLDYARDHTRPELLDKMEEDGINVDALNLTKIAFPASQETRKRWRAFSKDPRVKAYCEVTGLEDPQEAIFNLMMDVCSADWIATEELRKINEKDFEFSEEE